MNNFWKILKATALVTGIIYSIISSIDIILKYKANIINLVLKIGEGNLKLIGRLILFLLLAVLIIYFVVLIIKRLLSINKPQKTIFHHIAEYLDSSENTEEFEKDFNKRKKKYSLVNIILYIVVASFVLIFFGIIFN